MSIWLIAALIVAAVLLVSFAAALLLGRAIKRGLLGSVDELDEDEHTPR